MTIPYFNSAQDSNDKNYDIKFPYKSIIELQMITFYQTLSEKDQRLYAATEAIKFLFT